MSEWTSRWDSGWVGRHWARRTSWPRFTPSICISDVGFREPEAEDWIYSVGAVEEYPLPVEPAKCRCGSFPSHERKESTNSVQMYCTVCGRSGPYMLSQDAAVKKWNEDRQLTTGV